MTDDSHIRPLTHCPFCNKRLDRAANIPGETAAPSPGDFALCFGCGEWHVYTETDCRKPTTEEYEEIATNPDCRKVRSAWLQLKK